MLDFRGGEAVLEFRQRRRGCALRQAGVVTPDHTIRTKNWPLIVPAPEAGKLADFTAARAGGWREFVAELPGLFRAQQRAR